LLKIGYLILAYLYIIYELLDSMTLRGRFVWENEDFAVRTPQWNLFYEIKAQRQRLLEDRSRMKKQAAEEARKRELERQEREEEEEQKK
jgi:hypothetical protein